MEYAEHIEAIDREAARITAGLSAGPMELGVPTCPEWTLVDLATHLGQVCGLWSHVICEARGLPKAPFREPDPVERRAASFATWFRDQAALLVSMLGATDPRQEVWTFDPNNNSAAFIARRVANELAVHRVDVQLTRGEPQPIEGSLAVDGIDEIFEMITAWRREHPDTGSGKGESLQLSVTEPVAEWLVRLTPEGTVVEGGNGHADLTLQGTASDVELTLFDRPALGPLRRLGDERALNAWYKAFRFG